MATYVETVKPVVDRTIFDLSRKKFRPDPIGGPRYSRIGSLTYSAYIGLANCRQIEFLQPQCKQRILDSGLAVTKSSDILTACESRYDATMLT